MLVAHVVDVHGKQDIGQFFTVSPQVNHLAAYAIDDLGNQDPDDALSLEGDRLWVHIADPAALVPPDSEADLEGRARGANIYLPEQTIPMLPPQVTQILGMGLKEVSPALSFGIDFDAPHER